MFLSKKTTNPAFAAIFLLLAGASAVRAENAIRLDPGSVQLDTRVVDQEESEDSGDYQIPTRIATASVALDSDDISDMPSISFPTMNIEGSSRSTGEPALFTKMASSNRTLDDGEMTIWQGAMEGDEIGFATLIRTADGQLAGSFTVGDASYTMVTDDGSIVIRAVLFSELPDEGEEDSDKDGPNTGEFAGSPLQPIDQDEPLHRALRGSAAGSNKAGSEENKLDIRDATKQMVDSQKGRTLQQNSIIDVLVVVTNRAMCEAKGRPHGCAATPSNREPIEQSLRVAEAQTNTAMQAIGISAGIRIVRIHHDTTGFDGDASASSSLFPLSNQGDGVLDYIHDLRNDAGADFVALITGHSSACGVGFRPGEFSVTARACLGGYTFTHELGHNLGCYHNPEAGTGSSHAYANGYLSPTRQFRTVMAYDCPGGCPRIPYFSNDDYSYSGRAMGDSTHDNARMIRASAPSAAARRPTAGGGGSGSNNYFYIINPATNKALDVSGASCSDGTNIHLWERNGTPAQIFRFGDNNNSIINVQCDKAVDVSGGTCSRHRSNIHLWRQNGTGAQSFRVDSDGTIVSTLCNKALHVIGTSNGANIKLDHKNGQWDQQWRIEYI